MRKLAATALALPVLATLYVPLLLRRSIALRLVLGIGLVGLLGPAINVLAWRGIGIFGYAVVFPLTCLALSRAFAGTPSAASGACRPDATK